ncbi:hypothetical protein COS75_02010 [Candidatus Pacearchaeota archaeon CG06_land_8_20_14_3_00_35_12]|nr:MAG: hypothetical protein COS75_02010 [Candidatus Pacearchaeota archaeon CG06_land_8_20_14_3_00_35_12]
MIFKPETAIYNYEIIREAGQEVMYINYIGAPFVPSLADSAVCMARTVDALLESPTVSRIVFVQHNQNYSYDLQQISMLFEIAQLYNYLLKQEKVLSVSELTLECQRCLPQRYDSLRYLVLLLLKQDPIGCYVETKRLLRDERINAEKMPDECASCETRYIRLLEKIASMLAETRILKSVMQEIEGLHVGNRELYKKLFRPISVPNFTFTRLMASIPPEAQLLDEYVIGEGVDKSTVTIFKVPNSIVPIYHLIPQEFVLSDDEATLLNLAREVLTEHQPKAEEFTDPERIRNVFFNISRDLLTELSESKKKTLTYKQLTRLATILVRHTIGFGLIEVLLQDERLQDIVINSPVGQTPIFVRHQDFDECSTNIISSIQDVDGWAAKFRMISGRPLDEANPVLDTDLILSRVRARIAVMQQPLAPDGLAYAIRRHRDKPWTLPLFIKQRMINPLAAGLLSFLVDGSRTMLIAGTRSSGKTSLLGSLMLEIMPKYRIITVEDTLELPVEAIRKLNYDIVRMKVRAALLKATTEVPADEGIRTSLRLGDSCLIVGEVRSEEARALYEAMRVGALANVVAGTIHGASPYAIFDRVVNDLNVPVTSFKATDIIAVANPIKSPDGMHSWRRMLQITEVRKHWTKDPFEERGFADLLTYNIEKDELEATDELMVGESDVLKDIASNVKGWAGNWDALWDNILLRAKIKEELLNASIKAKIPELLEAPFVVKSNSVFHQISSSIREEIGVPLSKEVLPRWQKWLKDEIKRARVD